MPEEILRNPAVNPVVDTDGSSNIERRRYNSTTDDLLDRIRQAVEAINGGGGGEKQFPLFFVSGWFTLKNIETYQLYAKKASAFLMPIDDVTTFFLFIGGMIHPIPEGFICTEFNQNAPLKSFIGRLSNSFVTDHNFSFSGSGNIPNAKSITIPISTENITEIEVVVLPNSLLNENTEDNYFTVTTDGYERKYFLDSFNGIPIITTLKITDLDFNNEISISASTGIHLEYTIKASYPKLIL